MSDATADRETIGTEYDETEAEKGNVFPKGFKNDTNKALQTLVGDGKIVIGHFGALEIDGRPQQWWSIRYGDAVERLLTNPDYKVAQILSVLGSEVRLAILRCVLPGPKTAAEIVSELKMGTTGQAYHHLRELERAGYVKQKSGKWHFDMRCGRVYLTALALAADAGAEEPDEPVANG